ncbi:hypothetical protein [Natronococcus amylolyticus]|uniref:hypothetical protein n=1 Tax=Natronococcus amylolyticus TaxID=44470 RepID=UPI0012687D56|nr:hypothetical protein [Natronococcus amylolyticus]
MHTDDHGGGPYQWLAVRFVRVAVQLAFSKGEADITATIREQRGTFRSADRSRGYAARRRSERFPAEAGEAREGGFLA